MANYLYSCEIQDLIPVCQPQESFLLGDHGSEFDKDAQSRMISGCLAALPQILKRKDAMGRRIAEFGPYLNPLVRPEYFPNSEVCYFDKDAEILRQLQGTTKAPNVKTYCMDLNTSYEQLKLNLFSSLMVNQEILPFDSLVISQVFNYIDYKVFLKAIQTILAPNAVIVINNVIDYGIPNLFSEKRPKSHLEMLKTLANLGFCVEDDICIKSIFPIAQKNDRHVVVVRYDASQLRNPRGFMNVDSNKRLNELEAISRELESSSAEFQSLMDGSADVLKKFIASLDDRFAYQASVSEENFLSDHFTSKSTNLENAIGDLVSRLSGRGIQTASGHFMGYIPGGGVPAGAIADLITGITNRYSGYHFAAPDATEIENEVIQWLVDIFEMGKQAWGTLTSGGSIATLTAVLAARERLKSEDWSKACYYYTDQTHYVFERSIKISGMACGHGRAIPTDSMFRMDVDSLKHAMELDRAQGLIPWLVVASAGTTNTGAIDPIESIADVCALNNVWFHIDAAYGGFFQLSESGRKKLRGLGRADSMVLDPHKGLFLSYGTGALIVKDHLALKKVFSETASFVNELKSGNERSPADYSIELTRHSRAPRIWLCMRLFGLSTFAAALEEKLLLTQYLFESLSKFKEVTFACDPQLSVLAFQVKHKGINLNQELLDYLLNDGQSYLSSTILNGESYVRVCILSFRTHKAHVDALRSKIGEFIDKIGDKHG